MKHFLRKIFFWDDPAGGWVFGYLVGMITGYCFANLVCLSETFFSVMHCKTLAFGGMLYLSVAVLLLQILLWLYSAFLNWRFYFLLDRRPYKLIFLSMIFLQIAAVPFCKDSFKLYLLINGVIVFAGFNALCIKRNNYWWYIAVVLSGIACLPGAVILNNASQVFEMLDCTAAPADGAVLPAAWRPVVVYASVAFFIAFVFANIKLWASACNKSLREVWCIGCTVLLILLGMVYSIVLEFALFQQKQCRIMLAELEKNFRQEISIKVLEKQYYANRATDEKFHEELKKVLEDFTGKDSGIRQIMGSSGYLADVPEEHRQKFFSPEAEKIGKFFDSPLPARKREYVPGNLFALMMPDLHMMRNAARFFTLQMQIASLNKDHDAAILAWRRSANIAEYLEHDGILLSSLVLIAVNTIRCNGLEYMLAAGFLSDGELLSIQKELEKNAQKMPQINRQSLYAEAVGCIDTMWGIANGIGIMNKVVSEGIGCYRFLIPGLWYLGACNYYEVMKAYNVEKLNQVSDKMEPSLKRIFASMFMPALKQAGERMDEMAIRNQSFSVLIEAIRIRRATGRYPEKLPLDRLDCFSGKPLRYKVGEFEISETCLTKREQIKDDSSFADEDTWKYEENSRSRKVHGVIVWSAGRNRIDENGFSGSRDGERADDPSARLIL